ncbi:unnamed protein product, partial [Darwinula stevensoni]
VLNFPLYKKQIGETEYGLGWFPFGGYVKIAGMIDESMDEEAMKLPPKPDEFRSKPAYQRLIIMLGGIIVNVLLAFFIYAMILWKTGEESIPMKNAQYGFVCDSLAQSIGLKTGDKFLGYDNKKFEDATIPVVKDLLLDNAKVLHIEREGKTMDINIPDTAFISILLAFMNLLPIPALDGGHALFTVVEMVTGRKPSDKFLEYAQMVGMVLLFGLMIYANGNDLVKWIFPK